jgi:hypothetical protein
VSGGSSDDGLEVDGEKERGADAMLAPEMLLGCDGSRRIRAATESYETRIALQRYQWPASRQ